jgi:histidyl-tRNA synthetase
MGGGSFKSQLKRADKCQAIYAIIIGKDEIENKYLSLKSLRSNEGQVNIPYKKFTDEIGKILQLADRI